MRIVHAPTEIAGQMGTLIYGLRKLGHEALGYNWFRSYLNYQSSHVINTEAYELKKIIDPILRHTDIFHFHNGNSFLVGNADIPLLHDAGKKMVMHHWGNDVRTAERSKLLNKYPIPTSYLTDEKITDRLKLLSRYIRHAIVQDYELYPHVSDYYEHVHVIPLAVNVHNIPYAYPSDKSNQPTIIHAPTNREFKGSEYVEKAIADLNGKVPFNYRTIEKMSHDEAMKQYLKADIIIDQILCGTYGMLSVEAMAMGKVVVAYVRDDVRAQIPYELPIVTASPDTIRDVLLELVQNPEKRRQIGIAGRNFVKRYHAVEQVVPKILKVYAQLEKEDYAVC